MSTTPTPVYSAARAGLVGNAGATAASAQMNQFLGTHAAQVIYPGSPIITSATFATTGNTVWNQQLSTVDIDQPITMSGTTIGRVQLPLLPVGQGADLLVSLCQDSSGSPGNMIVQTRIPAAWISQLAAVSGLPGPSSITPTVQLTNNPLAAAQFQSVGLASITTTPYPFPATTGTSAASSTTTYGSYIFQIGGVNGGNALSSVFSIPFSGSVVGQAIPQPAFPTTNDGSSASCVVLDAVTNDPVVVNTGGGTAFLGPAVATVYTSNLSTDTGALSAWSAQTSLPYTVQSHTMVSNNGYVYSIGGKNSGGTLGTVSYAQVQNSQITAWNNATPLPQLTELAFVAVSNNFMFVIGGTTSSLAQNFTNVWYAQINSDGSLGPWLTGPSLVTGGFDLNINPFGNNQGIICQGVGGALGAGLSALPVTKNGPAYQWMQQNGNLGQYPGYTDQDNGTVQCVSLITASNEAAGFTTSILPYISVPLPATGLTNGTKYHILMQQQGGDLSDYLCTCVGFAPFSGITGQTSARNAYVWSPLTTNYGVSLTVFNQALPSVPSMPLHTWEDSGARISTFVQATTPDKRLLGLCEATRLGVQLNQNSGFESGLTPWTVSGGTFTQSSTQAYEGKFSARCVPNGTATQIFMQSENLQCLPNQSITVSAWFWFTLAVTNNCGVFVNWYTNTGSYITTAVNSVSAPATTWTQLSNTFTAPATAYQFSINPILGGTPSASNIFYVDNAMAEYTFTGIQDVTVAQWNWNGTWPNVNAEAPLGSTVLA